MKILEGIQKFIYKAMEWVGIVLVALLTILSICSVILRYCFNTVFIQTEELITFLFIATVFLGSAVVMYKKEHVSVTLLQMYMPRFVQKIMSIFQYVLMIAVNILLVYASSKWIVTNMNFLTPGLRIPYWVIYIVVPVGCVLSSVIAAIDLLKMIVNFRVNPVVGEEVDQ